MKANQPDVVVNFFDADGLTGEDRAEIDFFLAQTDATTMGNHNRSVVEGIVDVRQSLVRTRRSLIDIRRTLHAQSFMRSFVVEDLNELVEARLLLEKISRRRLGGFFLQGEVHALVTTVLLRRTWFDPFDADPQAQPPDCQLAQVKQGVSGSEGTPLSLRMLAGSPRFLKSRSNTVKA